MEKVNAIKSMSKYYIIIFWLKAGVREETLYGNFIQLKRFELKIFQFTKGPFVLVVLKF